MMSNTLCPALTRREFTRHAARALAVGAMSGSLATAAQAIAAKTPPLRVGAATSVITPPLGSWQQGAGVTRKGERIRDELEANSLYMTDGQTSLLLLSCDLVGLELAVVQPIREAISTASGVPPRQVIITCTHTHSGPSLIRTNYHIPVDEAYIRQLSRKLVALANAAVVAARPAKMGWGKGVAQIGFNRRVCWADGTHSMHGDTRRGDFAGLEGPGDPAHLAIFAVDSTGEPIAVAYHNTSHPTTFYGAGLFSADYPGAAREILRRELGHIPVLYLNGAQGDIAMANQLNPQREDREARLERIGKMLAAETLRLYRKAEFHPRIVLGHTYEDLQIKVRLPEAKQLQDAQQVLERVEAGEKTAGMKLILAFGTAQLQERFGKQSVDTVPIHVVRIGAVALVTQPCELYCQFGLDIKRRSPTHLTAVVGLADGYCGYCPTIASILGGGYSGMPISWTRLEPYAGYRMVEAAGPMMNQLWRKKKAE
jgi:neutral ceramidase